MGLDKKEEGREGQDRKDTRKQENGTQDTALKNVLGAEVTWSAVAAIGGTIVVVWNVVKYFFTFCSAAYLSSISHVPLYLLMRRRNLPFTDMFLVIITMAIMVVILSFTNYNPLLKKYVKGKRLFTFVHVTSSVLLVLAFVFDNFIRTPFYSKYPDFYYIRPEVIFFIYSFHFIIDALHSGKEYVWSKRIEKYFSDKVMAKKNWFKKIFYFLFYLYYFSKIVTCKRVVATI